MNTHIRILVGALMLVGVACRVQTAGAGVVTAATAGHTIVIAEVNAQQSSVSGFIVNKTPSTIRDVELLVQQSWLWNDEFHPGAVSPGRTLPFTFVAEVAPNTSRRLTLPIPPLAERTDGRFITTVDVFRFSEVGP